MPSLASIAGIYSCQLVGVDDLFDPTVTIIGVAWILVMTAICYIGIELSARTQQLLLTMEIVTLGLFSAVALYKVYVDEPKGSIKPSLSWINPFEISSSAALAGGILLGDIHLLGLGLRGQRQ